MRHTASGPSASCSRHCNSNTAGVFEGPGVNKATAEAHVTAAVAAVTHIAPADDNGEIIGSAVVSPGVIHYPVKQLGLCTCITTARYRTITEVYPDGPQATPEQCNAAQVAAVCAALAYALAHRD